MTIATLPSAAPKRSGLLDDLEPDQLRVVVVLLQPDGKYQEPSSSRAVPGLPLSDFQRFLKLAEGPGLSFAAVTRQLREWVRSLPPNGPTS